MSSLTTEQAFLQAIREQPDDDAPRLIFADWLEDNRGTEGQVRAEFIRAQCALERGGLDAARWLELEARQNELLGLHGAEWAGPCCIGCSARTSVASRAAGLVAQPGEPHLTGA
jgi:uncharacterized protein (TIGR02996 family)